ncbi:hypothetical protein PTMSG1_06357 [Pyrenophora teres f. maculata]|nr:hypothetical protein PTMSG1_06357 [Pyrenophora teres f. maculata]
MAQSLPISSSYQHAISKGTRLLALTLAPTPIPQSPFKSLSSLSTWGYITQTDTLSDLSMYHTIPAVLTALIAATTLTNPVCSRAIHETDVEVKGKFYSATMALFQNTMHAPSGILIAESNTTSAAIEPHAPRLPELRHWSDIAFLQWKGLAPAIANDKKPLIPELKVVVRSTIVNVDTKVVCTHIVNKLRAEHALSPSVGEGNTGEAEADLDTWLPTWPGVSFDVGEVEAKALCGTPNGKGVLWMLAQHRAELGHKTVVKVTLFYGDCEDLGDSGDSEESGESQESQESQEEEEEKHSEENEEESRKWKIESPTLVFWVEDVKEGEDV